MIKGRLDESKVKAALRAAFGFDPVIIEGHCFMLCEYFFRENKGYKTACYREEVYSNGQFIAVMYRGKKFRRFLHYTMLNENIFREETELSYFEIEAHTKEAFKVTTYAFGLSFHKFVRYV